MRVLIVEDEPNLGRQLRSTLEGAGYAVDLATDGEDGHYLGSTENYDAVVLDLGLPEIDGIARAFQRRLQLRSQRGFVFDNQDPHSGAFPLRAGRGRPHVSTVYQVRTIIAKSRCDETSVMECQGLRPTIRPVRAST